MFWLNFCRFYNIFVSLTHIPSLLMKLSFSMPLWRLCTDQQPQRFHPGKKISRWNVTDHSRNDFHQNIKPENNYTSYLNVETVIISAGTVLHFQFERRSNNVLALIQSLHINEKFISLDFSILSPFIKMRWVIS